MEADKTDNILEPLPYHVGLRDYLKSHERELWNWFASARAQADYTESLRMDLLKSTYRLDAESHPELYQGVEDAKAKLQLDIPVTVYQAQNNPHPNAALFFIPGEGHVVFSGPSAESAQFRRNQVGPWARTGPLPFMAMGTGGAPFADRLIQAVANDPRASTSHELTARRFQLYTEIFADRGSLCVTGDVHPVVAGLVKIETGLPQVSAPAYLKQAEEIFANESVATEGLSHPESFIRARALSLWQNRPQNVHSTDRTDDRGNRGARRTGFARPNPLGAEHSTAVGTFPKAKMVSDSSSIGSCAAVLR